MTQFSSGVVRWLLVAVVVTLEAQDLYAMPQTGKQADPPEVSLAEKVTKKLDIDQAGWQELTKKLAKAVETFSPLSTALVPEGQSLEAFRSYCQKLVESGKNLIAIHEKWTAASKELADSLRKAPAYYRSASQSMREKAALATFPSIKNRYLLTAEIYEELAAKAEERAKDLSLDKSSKGVVEFVREEIGFLGDFVKALDALPRVNGNDSGRYAELLEALSRHSEQSDELYRQLKLFHGRLKTSGDN